MSYDKQINDQYKKWKRNVTFLYDLVLAHVLEWPSTCIQWTGKCDSTSKRDVNKHEVLFSSRCLNPKDTTVNVANVDVPNSDDSYDFWGKEEGPVVRANNRKSVVQKKFGIFHPVSDKVVVKKKIIMHGKSNISSMFVLCGFLLNKLITMIQSVYDLFELVNCSSGELLFRPPL